MSVATDNTRGFTILEAIEKGDALTYNSTSDGFERADAVTEEVHAIALETVTSAEFSAGRTRASMQLSGVVEYAKVDGSGTAVEKFDKLSPSTSDGKLVKHAGTSTHVYAAKALADIAADGVIPVFLFSEQRAEP
jgi:hypothetical protein